MFTACFTEERRVRNDAAPHHDAGQLRILRFQRVQVRSGGHIAIVAHGHPAPGQGGSKSGTVGLPAVELAHHTWVDGQLTDGIPVIDVQNGSKFFRLFHAHPSLDRDRPFRIGKYGGKKSVQLDGVAQHPGTLAFGGDGAGRTAEVQVHLGVAQIAQLADHPCGQFPVLCQQLRDHRCAGVCRRGKLGHLLFNEHPVLRRGDERGIVAVGIASRAEPFLVCLPPHPVGQALHGGSIVIHGQISKAFDRDIVTKNSRPVKSQNGRSELFERSVCKQRGGQVAVAGIGQQDHDVLTGILRALCQLQGSINSST